MYKKNNEAPVILKPDHRYPTSYSLFSLAVSPIFSEQFQFAIS